MRDRNTPRRSTAHHTADLDDRSSQVVVVHPQMTERPAVRRQHFLDQSTWDSLANVQLHAQVVSLGHIERGLLDIALEVGFLEAVDDLLSSLEVDVIVVP
ncbi:uncharacterized protein CPUR_05408 [Claviceps purpurea 20.1]|uniref:Uncharacterized protein n=1 Tax=Claviceps purpurea (strain 20.1) TaxID=1111077 RepID=M1W845_CLAP2|nr:uncharacterized protein CPUR_05408 [Claviceps purpurea 20.1]